MILLVLALAATVAGVLLSDRTRPGLGGPTVLVWRVEGPVPEQRQPDILGLSSYATPGAWPTSTAASATRGATRRSRGLAVYVRDTGFGLAKAQEFRRQLQALSAAGKFVECYFESVGEGTNGTLGYFLATGCDHVYLAPVGTVNLLGLYADPSSSAAPSTSSRSSRSSWPSASTRAPASSSPAPSHSEPAREALDAVLDGECRQIVDAIAEARRPRPERGARLIDSARTPPRRHSTPAWSTQLLYPDQFRDRVEELAGGEPRLVRAGAASATRGGPRRRPRRRGLRRRHHRARRRRRSSPGPRRSPSAPTTSTELFRDLPRTRRSRRWSCGSTAPAARRSPPT